jgi:hypothetical protein
MAEEIYTTTESLIPSWAQPYAFKMLGQAENLAYQTPYVSYEGPRVAGFDPLQQQAYAGLSALGPAPQLGQATQMAGLAGMQAGMLGQNYAPQQIGQLYRAPRAQQLATTYQQMAQPEQFGVSQMQQYMSPYMQGVVDRQKTEAIQDYSRALPGLGASEVRAGAYGGTRGALMRSEAQRNLQNQLQGIQATGLQQAYGQAAQQFGLDRAAAMQAGQLNQAAQLQAQQQALGQLQSLNQLAQQNAQLRAQYGLSGAQQSEASRQFGATLGLQGLQQQLAAAGTLGQLGGQQFGQGLQTLQQQSQMGEQARSLQQQQLEAQYQDFLARQQYPYKQLSFMSNLLGAVPSSGQLQTQPGPSLLGQLTGSGIALAGLYNALGLGD